MAHLSRLRSVFVDHIVHALILTSAKPKFNCNQEVFQSEGKNFSVMGAPGATMDLPRPSLFPLPKFSDCSLILKVGPKYISFLESRQLERNFSAGSAGSAWQSHWRDGDGNRVFGRYGEDGKKTMANIDCDGLGTCFKVVWLPSNE